MSKVTCDYRKYEWVKVGQKYCFNRDCPAFANLITDLIIRCEDCNSCLRQYSNDYDYELETTLEDCNRRKGNWGDWKPKNNENDCYFPEHIDDWRLRKPKRFGCYVCFYAYFENYYDQKLTKAMRNLYAVRDSIQDPIEQHRENVQEELEQFDRHPAALQGKLQPEDESDDDESLCWIIDHI